MRVLDLGSGCQSCLGSSKSLVHRRGPSKRLARALEHIGEREQKARCAPKKASIKVHKPEEALKLESHGRPWERDDSFHVAGEWLNA